MLPLTQAQRSLLADKLLDVGNLAAGALIFGQVLSERPLSVTVAVLGFAVWLIVAWCAVALEGGSLR